MGFWHTGYIEFHEPAGLGDFVPEPTVYRCRHCSVKFDTPGDLQIHRFEAHPFNRPVLLVLGNELGSTPRRITKKITASDVATSYCEAAWINGTAVSPTMLGHQLEKETNDVVVVRLANQTASVDFRLSFEIASESDIAGVERRFIEVARAGQLDVRAIEGFIVAAQVYSSSIGYCDGICEYLYGVLAKERAADSSLPHEVYREKFTRAVETLGDFDRPLSRVIRCLVAFHFNQFCECVAIDENTRVVSAAQRFESWCSGQRSGSVPLGRFDDSLERILTDFETERLLGWGVTDFPALTPLIDDIESLLNQDISEFDSVKMRIMLAQLYAERGSVDGVLRHARELRNSPSFGRWAERMIRKARVQGNRHLKDWPGKM